MTLVPTVATLYSNNGLLPLLFQFVPKMIPVHSHTVFCNNDLGSDCCKNMCQHWPQGACWLPSFYDTHGKQTDTDRLIRCSSLIPECEKDIKIYNKESSKKKKAKIALNEKDRLLIHMLHKSRFLNPCLQVLTLHSPTLLTAWFAWDFRLSQR